MMKPSAVLLCSLLLMASAILATEPPAPAGPTDRIPYTMFDDGAPLAHGDVVDFGAVGPRKPARRSLVLHNYGPEPVRLEVHDFALPGSEFRFLGSPGGSVQAGEEMTLEIEATGQGRAGTEARKLTIDLTASGHESLTLTLRRTVREVASPCDTGVSLPPPSMAHSLWFEGALYPNCESLWWTLSDEAASDELTSAWRSQQASVERYIDVTGNPQEAQDFAFYISGRSTPHLIPMWQAFALVANAAGGGLVTETNLEAVRTELLASGLTPTGVEKIAQSLSTFPSERRAILEAIRQNIREMRLRVRRAASLLGPHSVAVSLANGGGNDLAEAAGLSIEEFETGVREANRNVDIELTLPRLEALLESLSLTDWLALRRFLLEHAAEGFEMQQRLPTSGQRVPSSADQGPGTECPDDRPRPAIAFDTMRHFRATRPSNKVQVGFRATARFIGPVFLQSCYTSLSTGCFMNYENSSRSLPITAHDPDAADFFNDDQVDPHVDLPIGDHVECREVGGQIPRCWFGNGARGTRYHSWIASSTTAGAQHWEDMMGETQIHELACVAEFLDISGTITGLSTASNVTIDLRAFSENGEEVTEARESSNFSGSSSTPWSYRERVPERGLALLNLRPSQATRCTFVENGETTLVKEADEEDITDVDIECCNANAAPFCKVKVAGNVVGLNPDLGEDLTIKLQLSSGETLEANARSNGRFEFDTEATAGATITFAPGSDHNSGDLTWSNENKHCSAALIRNTIELPQSPDSPLQVIGITCNCVPEDALTAVSTGNHARQGTTQNIEDCVDPLPPPVTPCDPTLPFWANPWECICERTCVETLACQDHFDPVSETHFEICDKTSKCSSSGGGCGLLDGPNVTTTTSKATFANGIEALSVDASATDSSDGVSGFLVFVDGEKVHQEQDPGPGNSGALSWGMDLASLAPGDHTLTLQTFDDNPTQKEVTYQDFEFTVEGSGDPQDPPPGDSERARLIDLEIPQTMACGSQAIARATYQNNGDTTWRRYGAAGGYKLGRPDGHDDPFDTLFRVWLPEGIEVPPGGTHTFEWTMTAPLTAGDFVTEKRMVHEGRRWFGEPLSQSVHVHCSSLLVGASADAWVSQDDAGSSAGGTSPELRVRYAGSGSGRFSLLRFELPPIDGTVLGARLRVHTGSQSIPAAAFYRVDNAGWSESTVNWDNWDDGGASYLYLRSGQDLTAGTWHFVDVSEALGTGSRVDLGIASSLDLDGLAFGSRESSHPPALEVLYCPTGTPGC